MSSQRDTTVDDAPDQGALIAKLSAIRADLMEEYCASHDHPWIIGFSGGKDSTLVAQLVFEMLLDLAPADRRRAVHLVSNDTLVESPVLMDHIDRTLARIESVVKSLRLPVTVAKTSPLPDQTFWVNLIGRGYPSPSRNFRWCTDRMKIQPTSHYIKMRVVESGEAILLLGVRREESSKRAGSINRYSSGQRLNPHNSLKGCSVFRPIVNLTTKEVWEILLQRRAPWGGSHRDLVTLYRNAQGGECPLVTDKSEAPSCGTSSSRLGCWTCTVITKDRSMEAFIESGIDDLGPLLDLRDWLAAIRSDGTKRQAFRRNGSTSYLSDGSLVPGPFTLEARQEILERLLQAQASVRRQLIDPSEIELIKEIWSLDATKAFAATTRPEIGGEDE